MKKYYTIRNSLIAVLCINSTMCFGSYIVSMVFYGSIQFGEKLYGFERTIAANFTYSTGVFFLGSVILSAFMWDSSNKHERQFNKGAA